MRRLILATALVLAAGCSKASAPPAPSAPLPTQGVVFHAYIVDIKAGGEPGSDRIQILLHATGPLGVTLRGSDGPVEVCPIAALGAEPSGACSTPGDDKAVTLTSAGVEVRATSGEHGIDDIAVAYDAKNGSVDVGSANIVPRPGASVCKDGCNPFYEMAPFKAGIVSANATWGGVGTGRLLIERGGMAAHDYSAKGKPYTTINESSAAGRPDVRVSSTVPATEVAVALENQGTRPLLTPTLHLTWT